MSQTTLKVRSFAADETGGPELVLCQTPSAHSAVAAVFVGAGSAYEGPDNNGISHLLEHVILAGTARYPSRQRYQRAVDATGGYLDALTHKEYTELVFQCFPEGVGEALELLAEAVVRPAFAEEAFQSERQIVVEEMLTQSHEGPSDPFNQMLWGSDSLGLPIIGRRDTLEALTPEALRAYHGRTYHAGNMVLVVVGPVSEERVLAGLEAFKGLPPSGDTPPARSGGRPLAGPEVTVETYRSDAADACLLFRSPGWAAADTRRHTVLQLMTQVFQTRIYQTLVGPALPVYHLYAGQEVFVPEGYVYFYFNVGRQRFRVTLERLLEALDALRFGSISELELEGCKRRYQLSVLSQLDDPRALAERLGSDRLLCRDRAVSVEEELAQIASVSRSEFDRVARETLVSESLHVVVRGGIGLLKRRWVRQALRDWAGLKGPALDVPAP